MYKILLIGSPRSGTSLLHSLLNSNQQMHLFFEKSFWHFNVRIINAYSYIKKIFSMNYYVRKESIYVISRYFKWVKEIFIYPKRLIFFSRKVNIKYSKKQYIGTKVCIPMQIELLGINHLYRKNWKIIIIYRDGRDSVLSMITRSPHLKNEYKWACYRWNRAIEIMKSFIGKTNVFTLPYESLLLNPENVLKRICNFLGIEFKNKMLLGYKNIMNPNYKGNFNGIERKRAFSFKKNKNQNIIKKIENEIKANLEYCNYLRNEFDKNILLI